MIVDAAQLMSRVLASDPEARVDPYPFYRAAREGGPVVPGSGRNWHVLGYAEVEASLHDRRLTSAPHVPPGGSAAPPPGEAGELRRLSSLLLLLRDPPDHTRLRRLVASAFTPRVVEALRADVQAILDELLNGVRGEVEIISSLADPLPARVIASVLDIPRADWPRFEQWSEELMSFRQDRRSEAVTRAIVGYLRALIALRRAGPGDDLVSGLLAASDEGGALSEDEVVAQCLGILVAGHETTTAALGSALLVLLRDRDLWAGLDPSDEPGLERAVEELLRYESPFQFARRTASEPFQLGGRSVEPGDTLWLWIGSANHDPAVFVDPDAVILDRRENRHLAFGKGAHYCLGAALARLEMRMALATLRERVPDLRPAGAVGWREGAVIRGPKTLPVIATPEAG